MVATKLQKCRLGACGASKRRNAGRGQEVKNKIKREVPKVVLNDESY